MKHLFCFLFVLSGVVAGCADTAPDKGYTSRSVYPAGADTVFVEMFATREFRRDIEFRLTEAVLKRLASHADLKVVPRKNANTILTGVVRAGRIRTLSAQYRVGLPQEEQYRIVVDVNWKDLRSGKVLMEEKALHHVADFLPPLRQTPYEASAEAIDRLAALIVQKMEADW